MFVRANIFPRLDVTWTSDVFVSIQHFWKIVLVKIRFLMQNKLNQTINFCVLLISLSWITILNSPTEVTKIPNFAIFIHSSIFLINFQTNSHNIKNLQSITKNTLFTISIPYGPNTLSILHTSLQFFFSAPIIFNVYVSHLELV